MKDVEV